MSGRCTGVSVGKWVAGVMLVWCATGGAVAADLAMDVSDIWWCGDKRAAEVTAGVTTLNPCGHQCPSLVSADPKIGNPADLTIDGWYVYVDKTNSTVPTLYSRKIRNGTPTAVTTDANPGNLWFSPDGEWVLYKSGANAICMAKPDGTKNVNLGIQCHMVTWYYKSPNEDRSRKIYEIAWDDVGKTNAFAQIVDLSGAEPKLGAKRQIARGMAVNTDEFAVAGDILLWDEQLNACPPGGKLPGYSDCVTKPKPTVLYTIPSGGLGTAEKIHRYPVWGPFNCGASLSWDGQYWMANNGRYYGDCIPNGHMGFHFSKVKRYTDPKVTIRQWLLEPDKGAGTVNWVPKQIDGKAMWGVNSDWGAWRAANDHRWVCGAEWKSVLGGWLIDRVNGVWYRLTTARVGASAIYLTSGATPATTAQSRRPSSLRKAQSLNYWTNLLGRSAGVVDAGKRAAAPGMTIDRTGARGGMYDSHAGH